MAQDFEAFETRLLRKGFGLLLGCRLDHIEDGYCRVRLPFKPELSRGDALIHGGVISALIDKAGTAAAWSYEDIAPTARGATVALNVNFIKGARGDLMAHARVVRRGGTLTIVDVDVLDTDGDIVAKGPVTYKLSR
jgi:uncharacterized protein (TIGR00369 family)